MQWKVLCFVVTDINIFSHFISWHSFLHVNSVHVVFNAVNFFSNSVIFIALCFVAIESMLISVSLRVKRQIFEIFDFKTFK